MSSILIVGGTGLVGSAVAAAACARGHAVRSISREVPAFDDANFVDGVDYRACDLYHSAPIELDGHLQGIDAVIDCLNGVSHVAQAVFRVGAVQITDAAARARVNRIVVVSDVGCDQSDFAYYEAKTDQEGIYLDSAVATTVVRFTVAFEQMQQIIEKASRFRVMPTSRRAQLQPIDVNEMAEVIVDATRDVGADEIRSYGGPEVASIRSFSRQWVTHTGRQTVLVSVPLVSAIGRYLRSGANIVPDSRYGSTTWQDWLDRSTPPAAQTTCESNPHPNGTPSPA